MNFSSPILGRVAPKWREPNLPSDKYGRLSLVSEVPGQTDAKPSIRRWVCLCDCGLSTNVQINNLRNGHTESCGCLHIERIRTHGATGTRTLRIWQNVVQRCTNPNNTHWNYYGGRGIILCDRWLSFENFLADMGEAEDTMSIDRIDNSLGYFPGNCKWSTLTQQARNKRSNRLVSYQGRNICLAEAVEIASLDYSTVYRRLNKLGQPISHALGPEFSDPI